MSLEFQKLKPKRYCLNPSNCLRFAKKSFKHSQESRYWKKFQNVLIEKEGDAGGLGRSDLSFCQGLSEKANLLATAVSARVDLYRLTQPEEEEIKPVQRLQKFKDIATAVQLRQDGNIVLCGEKTGRIQLIELQNKFVLKTYEEEHANQINAFAFKQTMREFVAGANDTNIKVFDILE
jgi:WD40 repeat protein